MPSLVGPVKINSISSAAQVNFGDSLNVAPKNNSKSYGGGGAFSTGDLQYHFQGVSNTNTLDSDVNDEQMAGNN